MSDIIEQITDENGNIDARSINPGRTPTGSGERRSITERDCYRLRVALLYGAELREHTRAAHYQRSGAHHHATGKCSHDTVSVPALLHTSHGHGSGDGEWVIKG